MTLRRIIRLENLAAIDPEEGRECGSELVARVTALIEKMSEAEAAEKEARWATLYKAN